MTTIELFLKLVRNALWQTEEELPEELSANMTANILRGGREQGLIGLVTDALVRNKVGMPQEKQLEVMVMRAKVRQMNEEINVGLRRLKELFDERGIDFVVVKGQAVGAYYPDPTLRQAGDIDYYCDAQNFTKAQEAVSEAWGITADANGSLCHVHYDYKDVVYEAHFALTRFNIKKMDEYWQRLVDEDVNVNLNVNDDLNIRTLSPTLHAVYVFVHFYSHLIGRGAGFRQMCDLAVLLHT